MRRWVDISIGTRRPSSMTFTTRFQSSQDWEGTMAKIVVMGMNTMNVIHNVLVMPAGSFFLSRVKTTMTSVASARIRLRGALLSMPQISFWGVISVSQVQPRTPADGVRKVWKRMARSSGARNRSRMALYCHPFFLGAAFGSADFARGPKKLESFLGSGSALPQ